MLVVFVSNTMRFDVGSLFLLQDGELGVSMSVREGSVLAICVATGAGRPMISVNEVKAIAGAGLEGDRYCVGKGSFNKGEVGRRQVTFMNGSFIGGSGYIFGQTRRNICVGDVELMRCIGHEFYVGTVLFRGTKYCEPCSRPGTLLRLPVAFDEAFHDTGGLVAEVLTTGIIRVFDKVYPPSRSY